MYSTSPAGAEVKGHVYISYSADILLKSFK